MGLDDWRSRIDNLDEEILNLLNRRGQAALQIGELKRQQDLPYFVPERESQILERLVALNGGPLSADAVRAVWREILSASLALEHPLPAAHLPDARAEEMSSTTASAERAREDPTVAAIASEMAARLYDVPVLRARIEDNAANSTRFLVLGRQATPPTGRDKTSILFSMK